MVRVYALASPWLSAPGLVLTCGLTTDACVGRHRGPHQARGHRRDEYVASPLCVTHLADNEGWANLEPMFSKDVEQTSAERTRRCVASSGGGADRKATSLCAGACHIPASRAAAPRTTRATICRRSWPSRPRRPGFNRASSFSSSSSHLSFRGRDIVGWSSLELDLRYGTI